MQPQHQSDEPQIMVSIKFTHKLITAQKITADPQNKVRKKNQLTGEKPRRRGVRKECIWFSCYLWINKTWEIWEKVCKQRHCCLDPKKVRSQQLPPLKHHQKKNTSAMSYNALLVNSPPAQCAYFLHSNLYFRTPKQVTVAHVHNSCTTSYIDNSTSYMQP